MIPALQRFYGGDPTRWGHVPLPLLTCFITMLPRLQALESLRRSAEAALGSGAMKKENARSLSREWRKAAQPNKRARKATPKDLKSLPIKVTRVPLKEP